MDGIAHIMIGLIGYYVLPFEINLAAFLLGSIILDVDHFFGFILRVIRKNWKTYEINLGMKDRLGRFPRTFFHSLFGVFVVISFTYVFTSNLVMVYSVFLGLILHLVLDSLDRRGVHWFWPFHKGLINGNMPAVIPEIGLFRMSRRFHYTINFTLMLLALILFLIN